MSLVPTPTVGHAVDIDGDRVARRGGGGNRRDLDSPKDGLGDEERRLRKVVRIGGVEGPLGPSNAGGVESAGLGEAAGGGGVPALVVVVFVREAHTRAEGEVVAAGSVLVDGPSHRGGGARPGLLRRGLVPSPASAHVAHEVGPGAGALHVGAPGGRGILRIPSPRSAPAGVHDGAYRFSVEAQVTAEVGQVASCAASGSDDGGGGGSGRARAAAGGGGAGSCGGGGSLRGGAGHSNLR
mmetsp:Transcript_16762/g.48259  ORF Transcript_16762/g.48259 Transcript_16762/m.48259 type:complete len:239 (-) Transcript_16762:274-990(-)